MSFLFRSCFSLQWQKGLRSKVVARDRLVFYNFSSQAPFRVKQVPSLPIFQNSLQHLKKTAIISSEGSFRYGDLLMDSELLKEEMNKVITPKYQIRIANLTHNGYNYVRSQWATWRNGGIFVPLCVSHPIEEMEYVLRDSGTSLLICDEDHLEKAKILSEKCGIPYFKLNKPPSAETPVLIGDDLPKLETYPVDPEDGGMIVYTSGTTGRPKGVFSTHNNIRAQIEGMTQAWEWTSNDHILHTLPLHHVHGIVNVLLTPLWNGAICEMMQKFHPQNVWKRIMEKKGLTLYMAVPTIYAKLIQEYERMDEGDQKKATEGCQNLRLMVSGSAALPSSIMMRWKEISTHTLLERYGMTEIGMALTNPLHGRRIEGAVGQPFPGVQVRIVNPTTEQEVGEGESGELRVKGPSVFKYYWNREEDTKKEFDSEGWFKTGDIAQFSDGVYRILGRASVDIIKSGGYKLSALEIERVLSENPDILECIIVGVEDPQYGQRVGAIVVPKQGVSITLNKLREWAKQHLAAYKLPTKLLVLDSIPKNAMGKPNKKELVKLFDSNK